MAVSTKRVRKFDADAIVAFARALDVPIWKLFVPPAPGSRGTHGRPVKVKLRGTSDKQALDDGAMFDLAVGSALPSEPRSEEERRQRERETARVIAQVLQFAYDHGLLPKPQPLPNLPPEAQADLEKAVARVRKKHGIDLGPKEASRPSLGQIEMLVKGLEAPPERRIGEQWHASETQVRVRFSSGADGRWCAQLDLGWEGGRRRRKYFYGTTAARRFRHAT